MTKRRVSAKQRLELVEQAFRILNEETVDQRSQMDYEVFADRVQLALYDNLSPRHKEETPA